MTEDEYAIVSKKEFMALRKELDRLKKNPLEGSESGENLQSSIDNLNKSLNVMLEVFKQAADDMKLEEHDSENLVKQMDPLNDKIDTLIDQNQKIAKGIVAIADMVKEKLEELEQKEDARPRLPPLGGGPKPAAHAAPIASPPGPAAPLGAPAAPAGLPPMGAPEGMEPSGLPPLTPPGAPPAGPPAPGGMPPPPGAPPAGPKKDIMGGLMK